MRAEGEACFFLAPDRQALGKGGCQPAPCPAREPWGTPESQRPPLGPLDNGTVGGGAEKEGGAEPMFLGWLCPRAHDDPDMAHSPAPPGLSPECRVGPRQVLGAGGGGATQDGGRCTDLEPGAGLPPALPKLGSCPGSHPEPPACRAPLRTSYGLPRPATPDSLRPPCPRGPRAWRRVACMSPSTSSLRLPAAP